MLEDKLPILSIIIPTKNRQYTCMFAIKSALVIDSDIFEVIIQDCGDTDKLKEAIFSEFGPDNRLKYFYTDSLPSMTENWNLAISNSTGKYICGIGDDDSVLPSCIEVTSWMDANGIQAVLGALVNYIWTDAYIGSFSSGRLSHKLNFTGEIFEVEVHTEFIKKALNCGFGYTEELPNIYHGIVKKELLETHKKICGNYLFSTSLDVYNAMTLPTYLQKSYYIDFPLTVRGASGSSNSNRSNSKKGLKNHFRDFKNLNIPQILPPVLNTEVSIAESTIIALHDTKQELLISKMNLAIVYAKCAALDVTHSLFYYKEYKLRKNNDNTNNAFFTFLYRFLKDRFRAFATDIALKMIFSMAPKSIKYLEKITNKRKVLATDILIANKILSDHLSANKIVIKYSQKFKKLIPQKAPWD